MPECGLGILRIPSFSIHHPPILVTMVACHMVARLLMRDLIAQLLRQFARNLLQDPFPSACRFLPWGICSHWLLGWVCYWHGRRLF